MGPANETYKRGQVEWALWRSFALLELPVPNPPKVFLTRVKRLLETDREAEQMARQANGPPADFAFSSAKSEGQGVDALFTAFDALCLALALDLVDMGFKPSEVVLLLRHSRPELERRFNTILTNPPPKRVKQPPTTNLYELFYGRSEPRPWIDHRVFWVIQKVELKEIYREEPGRRGKAKIPVVIASRFYRGSSDLFKELDLMNSSERWGFRRALVLEIAYLAVGLVTLLAQAPATRRGPQ
jgi:hypothetical protein